MSSKGLEPVLIALLLLGLCSSPTEAAELRGKVRLDGSVPQTEMIPVERKGGDHSTEGCGSVQPSQRLLVDEEGGIANAVVWLEGGPPGEGEDRALAVLDQKECRFSPHVVVVPANGSLSIRNSDPIRHNIRIFPEGSPRMLMHRWQPADAKEIAWQFTQPGRYVVRCGVHPWMFAWVVSAEHPYYAVTNSQGDFTIPAAPVGRQRLHVWHETLGSLEIPVEIPSGDVTLPPIRLARQGER